METIDNVREWFCSVNPSVHQGDTDPSLTFQWIEDNIEDSEAVLSRMEGIDTLPRQEILCEALRRILERMRLNGCGRDELEAFCDRMGGSPLYTRYSVRSVLDGD